MLGLTNRLSACREIGNILSKYRHVITYNDIRLNEHWARTSFASESIYNDLKKNTPTHCFSKNYCNFQVFINPERESH